MLDSYRYLDCDTSISVCSSSCSSSSSFCSSSSSSKCYRSDWRKCNIDKYYHSTLSTTTSSTSFNTTSSSITTISSLTFNYTTCIIYCFCTYEYCSTISSSSTTIPTSIICSSVSSTATRTRWSFILCCRKVKACWIYQRTNSLYRVICNIIEWSSRRSSASSSSTCWTIESSACSTSNSVYGCIAWRRWGSSYSKMCTVSTIGNTTCSSSNFCVKASLI